MNTQLIRCPSIAAIIFFACLACHGQGAFVYDQQSGDESTIIGAVTTIQSNQPIGQSFTPSLPAVGFVRLSLNDATPGNSTGASVFVNLRTGSINGPVLGASGLITMPDNFGRGSNGYVNFIFSTPVPLTPGVTYYLQPVVQSGDIWQVGAYNFPTKYSGGSAFFRGVADPSMDLWFREGLAVPEPSAAWLSVLGFGMIALLRRRKPATGV